MGLSYTASSGACFGFEDTFDEVTAELDRAFASTGAETREYFGDRYRTVLIKTQRDVIEYRAKLAVLRANYHDVRVQELAVERTIRTNNPEVRQSILASLMANNPVLEAIDALTEFLDQEISNGITSLRIDGD